MSPLEIPLEVRKEMEIAWRQVRAVGRGNRFAPSQSCRADGREPQTSASTSGINMRGTHREQTFV